MSWRRVFLLTVAFVLVLVGATWAALDRSNAATALVQRRLSALLRVPAHIGSTELDLGNGRLVVLGLRIDDPKRPGKALATARRVDLDADLDPFGSLVALRQVTIHGLVVDVAAEPPTLDELLQPTAGEPRAALPALAIRDGELRFTAAAGREPFAIEHFTFDALGNRGDPRVLVLSGDGRVGGLDAPIHLAGEVDLAGDGFRLSARLPGLRIDERALGWLHARQATALDAITVAADMRDFVVTASRTGDGPLRIEAGGHLDDTRIAGPDLPRQLRSATVDFTASNAADGELRLHLQQHTEQGELDVTAEVSGLFGEPSFAVRAKGRELRIDDDMVHALHLFPIGARVVDALDPKTGRADIDLYLRDPQRSTGKAEFDLQLRDVEMAYRGYRCGEQCIGFPMPLVAAHGNVRLHGDIVVLEGLGAEIAPSAGGGTVRLDGQVDTMAPAGDETTIDIHAAGVRFTPDLRSALAGILHDDGALYDRLAPAGLADVDVAIRPWSQLHGSFAVDIEPRAATATWSGFPYRLEDLQGRIHVQAAAATFALKGNHGGGAVELQGTIPIEPVRPEDAGFDVLVHLRGLAVDDELRTAVAVMAPAIDRPWQACAPTGRCGGVVRAWRTTPEAPLEFDLGIDIAGVDLRLPEPPWYARDTSGRIVIQGRGDDARIDFDALRGKLDHGDGAPSLLAMLGSVHCTDTIETDLSLVVRGLQLDTQLGRSLEALGALGPGVWDYLRPSGSVDLVCRHHELPGGSHGLDVVVQLLDVGSDAAILPHPARKMTGELRIGGGRVTFEELRAEIGGKLVRGRNGTIAPETKDLTRIEFTVSAPDLPLDAGLANLFPEPMHSALLERELSGSAAIDHLQTTFLVPTDGSGAAMATTVAGQLRLQDVGLSLGVGPEAMRVQDIHGDVTLAPSSFAGGGGALIGTLRDGSLRLFDQPFESITTRFTADAAELVLSDLAGRFHGGLVSQRPGDAPALRYRLPHPGELARGRLAASLAFENVDVHGLLLRCGQNNPICSGAASGEIVLDRLDGHDIVDAEASGRIAIVRGDLGVVPLFTAIYAQLPAPERPRFDGMSARVALHDRRVRFDDLSLHSNLLGAKGDGTLDLDGYLDVRLQLDNLLGNTADPLLMPLIDLFAKSIVRYHLFGPLRDLRAEQRWVTESAPARLPVPPLPPIGTHRPTVPF